MTIHPVDLVDYVAIAAEITGMDARTIARLPNLPPAESALHSPFSGFGEHEFYPGFVEKPPFCSSDSHATIHSPTAISVLPG